MPKAFASTTVTNTITVKWNTQAIATLTVVTNYANTAGVATQGLGAASFITNANGGAGTCGTSTGEAAQVANFYNVTPDTANYTNCLYKNGANAFVATSDGAGYSLAVAGALPPSGAANPYILCLLPNPAGGWTTPAAGGTTPVTTTVRAAAPSVTTAAACGTVESSKGISLVAGTIQTSTGVGGTAGGANYGGDIELGIPALASAGAQAVTITYTLTNN